MPTSPDSFPTVCTAAIAGTRDPPIELTLTATSGHTIGQKFATLTTGLKLTGAPVLTVNWKAASGQQWTVPLGGGIGKIFHLGRLPVNAQLSAYYNVVKPDYGPNWQIRAQMRFMFPK